MGITYPSKALEYIKRLTDTKVPTESITEVPVHKIEPKNSATEQPFERKASEFRRHALRSFSASFMRTATLTCTASQS